MKDETSQNRVNLIVDYLASQVFTPRPDSSVTETVSMLKFCHDPKSPVLLMALTVVAVNATKRWPDGAPGIRVMSTLRLMTDVILDESNTKGALVALSRVIPAIWESHDPETDTLKWNKAFLDLIQTHCIEFDDSGIEWNETIRSDDYFIPIRRENYNDEEYGKLQSITNRLYAHIYTRERDPSRN